MTYRDNVEQAAEALGRGEEANWELARLTADSTWDATPDGRTGRVQMETWCRDVQITSGRSFKTGTGFRYKWVWRTYGALSLKERPAWADAWLENAGQTAETRKGAAAASAARNAPAETKREIFRELAADPAVVEDVAAFGSSTSRAVSELHDRVDTIREERRERLTQADPIARRLEHQGAALDVEAACNRFARDCERFASEISEALPRAGQAREEHLFWVNAAIERARAVLGQLEHYVHTGRTDLDAFLDEVLGGTGRV